MPPRAKKPNTTSNAAPSSKVRAPAATKATAPTSKGLKRAADASDADEHAPKKARLVVLDESDEEEDEAEHTDSERGTDDSASDSDDEMPPAMHERLERLSDMLSRLTDTYLRMITSELSGYRGPRGGSNALVADYILGYLEGQARNGSKLREEKELVKGVYAMCYGGCGMDDSDEDSSSDDDEEDSDEDEDWDKSDQSSNEVVGEGTIKAALNANVEDTLDELSELVEGLTKHYLKGVMRGLPTYHGSSSGTTAKMQELIVKHLKEEARNGSDLKEETRVIRVMSRKCHSDEDS